MALATDICATAYLGNGVEGQPYPVTWPFMEPAHIRIKVRNTADPDGGTWRTLADWEYTVQLYDDPEFETAYNPKVITNDTYGESWHVMVFRKTPVLQPTVWPEAGAFPAKSHETEADRGRMIDQEILRDLSGEGIEFAFGNNWWSEAQGTPFVRGKPFEHVSSGGNGAADGGRGVIFDPDGGLALQALKKTGFGASIYVGISETQNLVAAHDGKVLYYTGAPAITLTVGAGLPAAFSCKIVAEGSGMISIAVAGGLSLRHPDAHTKTRAQWSSIYISRRENNLFLEGDTAA